MWFELVIFTLLLIPASLNVRTVHSDFFSFTILGFELNIVVSVEVLFLLTTYAVDLIAVVNDFKLVSFFLLWEVVLFED